MATGNGQRHRQVFALARALKAIPELCDADPCDLREHVREWHRLALPHITTKAFDETWIDFLKAWPRVRFPLGTEPMELILQNVGASDLPAEAFQFEQEQVQILVLLCRELQRASGDRPFYLSCRTAGRLLSVDHATANRWLFLLVEEKLLAEIEKGSRSQRRASRYRYLAEL